jgi:hypothetical protein
MERLPGLDVQRRADALLISSLRRRLDLCVGRHRCPPGDMVTSKAGVFCRLLCHQRNFWGADIGRVIGRVGALIIKEKPPFRGAAIGRVDFNGRAAIGRGACSIVLGEAQK